MRKALIVSLSLSNLWFLNSWLKLLRIRFEAPREVSSAPVVAMFEATVLNVLLVASLFLFAYLASRRIGTSWADKLAKCAFLVAVITPLDVGCWWLWNALKGRPPDLLFNVLWGGILAVPLLGCVLLTLYHREGVLRLFIGVATVLAPLFVVSVASFGLCIRETRAEAVSGQLQPSQSKVSKRRLVWIIFDEWDYQLSFVSRPKSVEMPEVDRLASESLVATEAHSPAWETSLAMPSLLLGKFVKQFDPAEWNQTVKFADGTETSLRRASTVLSDARAAGWNTSLAGWHLDYCGPLSGQLTACAEPSLTNTESASVWPHMREQMGEHWRQYWLAARLGGEARFGAPSLGFADRQEHLKAHRYLRAQSLKMVRDPSAGLVLLHRTIPHPNGIWDREANHLSTRLTNNYFDNLELVDRAVGDVRRVLEQAGAWEDTILLLSSDHPFRDSLWRKDVTWDREQEEATQNKRLVRIPFILKLTGRQNGVQYGQPFNTVLTRRLIAALLKGELETVHQVTGWLDENRTTVPVEPPRESR